jgi:hypothetical protein
MFNVSTPTGKPLFTVESVSFNEIGPGVYYIYVSLREKWVNDWSLGSGDQEFTAMLGDGALYTAFNLTWDDPTDYISIFETRRYGFHVILVPRKSLDRGYGFVPLKLKNGSSEKEENAFSEV